MPRIAAAVLVTLATFVAFMPALRNDFVDWDDHEMLLNHSRYHGLGWAELRWMFTTFHMGHYQPLSWLSFGVDYLLWGTDAAGYHLTNIILHAAGAAVFFYLAWLLLALSAVHENRNSLVLGAAFAALFFSIHPLRVESVAWATERRDVLSGLFYLLALHGYLVAQTADDHQVRRRRFAFSVLVYALSLLAKGTAMTLPAVLVLLDVYPLRRLPGKLGEWSAAQYRRVWLEKLPFVVLAAAFAVAALLAQQASGALRPVQQYFLSYRLGQLFYSAGFYLWKTIFPVKLSPLYELPFDFDAWLPLFGFCALVTVAITLALYFLRHRWPAALGAWIYYLVVLAPVAGIAQSGPQLVADRYSYLSCLSWAVLAGGALARFLSDNGNASRALRHAATVFVAVIVTAWSALTWEQNKIWRDTKTLWLHATSIAPESSIAQYNLGRLFEDEGHPNLSLQHYRRAVHNNPANADAQYNLARLLAKLGSESEAEKHYRAALQVRPKDLDARNNLGLLLARRGETNAAMEQFRETLKIDPGYGKAHFNIGRISASRNELAPAIESYRRALELHPKEADILVALADALARQGQHQEAVTHLRAALEQEPARLDTRVALARALAAQGRKQEAEEHYQEALKLLQQSQPHSSAGALR